MTTVRILLHALLPSDWLGRIELLAAAGRIDLQFGDGAIAVVLFAFTDHRGDGRLPANANVRELVLAIGELCGGVRAEARHRPAEAVTP